jgi:puromycin-sensitive aminopeptidase
MKKKGVRLSKYIIPIRYDIELKPDLENFTFSGVETITISLLKPTRTLTLHSKEIEIVTAKAGDQFAQISYNTKDETATFTFTKPIPKGKIELSLVFTGILNDKMRGFYRSSYVVEGVTRHMATTQFEATDARRAFPCFDEPAQKSVFHVSLIVPKNKTAISNTLPVSVAEHEAGYQTIKFSPTPKMSTYLLAFIIGDFEYIESKTKRGVQVRVFTTPGKKHQAKFALECAVKTLDFYEKYFDIKYPLPVLDMIAIPDFSSGAMENWGAITYRESALLVDEAQSSASNKQWVALVIAHELAHQWFGNLVTMEWWTHLWLNEGFASYIEYLAVDKLFPTWDIWTQFSVHDLGVALRLDALATTHPIEITVHHPDEIGEIFDEVSYSKGASIIRMLASYLGENNFRDGLRYYLKKHSYKNTETIHLWQAFEKVSGKPVTKMMHNWTSKPGYPVVKAKMKNGKVDITQEKFFSSPISKAKAKDKTKWEIPIIFGKNKVNFGETGFFRTAYSKELLEKLKSPILYKNLSARDRLGIIRDLFALAEAGTIPTTDALEFLPSYKNEDNYTVWVEIASGLARLEQLLANSNTNRSLNKLSLELFSPLAHKLGWNKKSGEEHTNALLRSLAIARAGRAGDKKIINEAKKVFSKIKSGQKVNPDIRGAVYSIIATHGGMKEYKTLVAMYKKENLHEEKNRIGGALGDFVNEKILEEAANFALSKHVRIQDTIGILSGVGMNPLGRDIWLKCIKYNWKLLVSRYGQGGLTLGRAIKAIGGSAEDKHFKILKTFFATHEAPGARRSVDQVLERIESNIAWRKRDGKIIEKFFSKKIRSMDRFF